MPVLPFAIEEALHLCESASVAGTLREAGARRFVPIGRPAVRLGVNRCAADADEHAAAREQHADWWARHVTVDTNRRPYPVPPADPDWTCRLRGADDGVSPVVLWTDPTWEEWQAEMYVHHTLQQAGIRLGTRLWRVVVTSQHGAAHTGEMSTNEAMVAFRTVHRLPGAERQRGAALWRLYCRRSPVEFDRRRRAGFPGLRAPVGGGCTWLALFPRVFGRSPALHLSLFDASVLAPFRRRWTPGSATFRDLGGLPRFDGVCTMCAGSRLADWAEQRPSVLLRRLRAKPGADGVTRRMPEFRLTPAGRSLLEDGLPTLADAPPFAVGGCSLYYPREPWAVRYPRRDSGFAAARVIRMTG